MKTLCSILSLAAICMFGLTGCNEQITSLKQLISSGDSPNSGNVAVVEAERKTAEEDQWEYLVVSFGKTEFGDIESNIASGDSKLAAFKEFSTLLAGYEALDLQKKMDILGRFGWEAVEVVGAIGGEQELMFKRQRRANRIEAEQRVIAKLSSILREEAAEKEEQLKALVQELQAAQEQPKNELIELDSKEKREREKAKQDKLRLVLEEIFDSTKSAMREGVSIADIEYDVRGEEKRKGKTLMRGSVTVTLDGTGYLKKGNAYRASIAKRAVEEFVQAFNRQNGVGKVSGYSWEGLTLDVRMQIQHAGEEHQVASTSSDFTVKGFLFKD